MKKIALITGANKGLGFETARQLGQQGITVILTARDEQKGKEAVATLQHEKIDAHLIVMDVTDEASIERAYQQVVGSFGQLDILVNNAGIAAAETSISEVPLATVRKIFETNVFGAIAVLQQFLPLLKAAPAGRIVNVSSGLGSLTGHSDPYFEYYHVKPLGYNSSKTALNAVTVTFAYELRGTNVKINAIDPGYCATDLNGHSGPRTPEQGAAISVKMATLPADGPTGGFFNDNGRVNW
jgi:NAD(P)-dependent dehydrogenase (short-subunit alcohol dehydrogenase family)